MAAPVTPAAGRAPLPTLRPGDEVFVRATVSYVGSGASLHVDCCGHHLYPSEQEITGVRLTIRPGDHVARVEDRAGPVWKVVFVDERTVLAEAPEGARESFLPAEVRRVPAPPVVVVPVAPPAVFDLDALAAEGI